MRVRLIVLTHGKELLIVAYVFSNYLHDLSQTVHAHYPKQEIFGKKAIKTHNQNSIGAMAQS